MAPASPPGPPTHNDATSMTLPVEPSITELVRAAGAGDERAVDQAFPLVYDELRRLAAVVRRGRSDDTYNATALVHEAYIKLVRSEELTWNDRAHFLCLAARAMRQVLVDQATRKAAAKRGGGRVAVTLADAMGAERTVGAEELLDLDRAVSALATESPRAAKVVECRFFGGMSAEETAVALSISAPTVTRDWRFARAWLSRRLTL